MSSSAPNILGESPSFLSMLEHVSHAAPLDKPLLIIGERGTGKELVSQRLHFLSKRWDEPLVKLNCAALTESLLESELFGHEAGAFTGAVGRHVGRFERAEGGTLLLDELGTIPLRMQEKILRVIEYGEFERVGGSDTLSVDVRVVGSTNEDLPRLARRGGFRHDLLDRLAFDVITVPPLRARPEDILMLGEHFGVRAAQELGRPLFPGFSEGAREILLTHPWPGNVRELKNVVERSLYRWPSLEDPVDEISLDPFASPFRLRGPAVPDTTADSGEGASAPSADHTPALPVDLPEAVGNFEVRYIRAAMDAMNHNQRAAAELLGLTYHQLRGRLRKYDLS
ncbi:MAG: phage shock protein operon transcriptional activator [Pseudomonadota bacterium]